MRPPVGRLSKLPSVAVLVIAPVSMVVLAASSATNDTVVLAPPARGPGTVQLTVLPVRVPPLTQTIPAGSTSETVMLYAVAAPAVLVSVIV